MADINPFTQIEEESQTVNPFEEIEGRGEFTPDTLDDINRLNENPGNREFMFVPGRNVNVDLPKGGISRTWELMRRSFNVGDKTTQLGTLASNVIFGDKSPETEEKIKKLQKSLEGPDPVIGVLPPPQEGWVNYIATAISEQIPNLIGMAHEGLEDALAAGATTMAATALAGPAAPAIATLFPIAIGGGFATGSLNYAFNQIAGSSYLEYREFTDKEGNKLSDDMAKLGAVMSGVIGTGLEALPFGLLAKIMPGASKIFQKAGVRATEALKFPTTTQAMKTFLFNMAKVAAAEGITESLQEVVQIETGEALKFFSKGQFEPVSTGDMWARIQEAGLKGAIVGGGISIPVAGARAVSDISKGRTGNAQKLLQQIDENEAIANELEFERRAEEKAGKPTVKQEKQLADLATQRDKLESDLIAEIEETVRKQTAKSELEAIPEETEPTEIKPEVVAEVTKEVEEIVTEAAPEISKATEDTSFEFGEAETIAKVNESLKKIAPSQKTRETLLKGRLDKLDTDILNIDKEINAIEKEIVQKKLSKEPTKRLENKSEKLLAQREKLDVERENLIFVALANDLSVGKRSDKTIGTFQALLNKDILRKSPIDASKDILIKGEKIVKLEERSLKDQASALAKGLREGARLAKKDIKQAIKNTKQLIRASSLPKDTKDAIIAQFVTGEQDFVKNIPQLKSKIATEFERLAVKEQKERINKSLSRKTLKPITVSGVKQGKFDAEAQVVLEDLAELNKVSGKVNPDTGESDASKLLDERLLIDTEVVDPLGNAILNMRGNPRNVTSAELEKVADAIDILLSDGRDAAKERVLARSLESQRFRTEIITFLSDGKNLKAQSRIGTLVQLKKVSNSLKNIVSRLVDGWDEIVSVVLPGKLARQLELGREMQIEKGIRRRLTNKLVVAAETAFGMKDGRKLKNRMDSSFEIKVREVNGETTYTNIRGEVLPIEWSLSEVRNLYMLWQDETLHETLTFKEGNAFDRQFLKNLFDEVLSPEDKIFAKEQLKIYKEFYPEINEVYSKTYGINLTTIENYSPIRREVDLVGNITDEFGNDINHRVKIAGGSPLKARVGSIKPLQIRSDIDVFNRHVATMARFIALREKTQLLNSVFGSADVVSSIKAVRGTSFNTIIGEHLESFASGAHIATDDFQRAINYLNRNFAVAQLGLKAKIGLTQLTSYFAYAETIPTKAFISGTRDFFLNMPTAIRTLNKSEFLIDRGYSPELEIARMGKAFDSKFLDNVKNKREKLADLVLIATKIGDRIPIYVGGWALYKHTLEKTGSATKAMEAFERMSNKTQQSKDLDQLSLAQKSSPLMRGMTMFMSAPIAQFRGEMRAFRELSRKEITPRQFAKKILIYHFMLPSLYQALANGLVFGEWDNKDQLRAAILGTFNGIPLLGEVIESAYKLVTGDRAGVPDVFKWAKPLLESSGDLITAFAEGKEGDYEDMVEAIMDSFANAGALTGLPASQIENIRKAFEDLENSEMKAATMRFLGWPESVIKNIE